MSWLFLFFAFVQISLLSFGGIYSSWALLSDCALNPVGSLCAPAGLQIRQDEVSVLISLSNVMPGPQIASLSILGVRTYGHLGMVLIYIAMVLPSVLLVPWLTKLYMRHEQLELVQRLQRAMTFGVCTILTVFVLTLLRKSAGDSPLQGIASLLIGAGSFVLRRQYDLHPALLVLLGGAAGYFFLQ